MKVVLGRPICWKARTGAVHADPCCGPDRVPNKKDPMS